MESSTSVHRCLPNQISGHRALGEVEKDKLYYFARQRGTQWAPALENCVSQPGRIYWGFYNNGSKVGSLTRSGCEQGFTPFILSRVVSWLLFPWLATVRICPLELGKSWRLQSCLQEMGDKRASRPGAPQGLIGLHSLTQNSLSPSFTQSSLRPFLFQSSFIPSLPFLKIVSLCEMKSSWKSTISSRKPVQVLRLNLCCLRTTVSLHKKHCQHM